MDRRQFLRRSTGAGVALIALPVSFLANYLPPIYGDGIHDDAPGIRARLERGIPVHLPGGDYVVGSTIHLDERTADLFSVGDGGRISGALCDRPAFYFSPMKATAARAA